MKLARERRKQRPFEGTVDNQSSIQLEDTRTAEAQSRRNVEAEGDGMIQRERDVGMQRKETQRIGSDES